MKYPRNSVDYQVNMESLREMEECVPMTKFERDAIRRWASRGNDIEINPWDFKDQNGWPLNFLQAYRLQYGYSGGPWDYWRGSEEEPLWDSDANCFIPEDDYR